MAKRFEKFLVLAVIFTMTIVNYGMPLQAIASEGESIFKFAFFRKNEISLESYFGDDSEKTEEKVDVNETAKVTLEITPLIEGYLKSGSLKFNLKNGNENNFKLKSVMIEDKDDIKLDEVDELLFDKGKEEVENEVSENVISNDKSSENTVPENKVIEDQVSNDEDKEVDGVNPLKDLLKNAASEFVEDEVKSSALSNLIGESKLKDELKENVPEDEKEEIKEDEVVEESDNKLEDLESNEEPEKEEIDIEKVKGTYEVNIVGDNEIALKNIIDSTKIFVEIEYKQSNKVKPEDLYGEIEVLLEGNYINKKLETVEITRKEELVLGWEYSKEIDVLSDFVKVSPFTVGENFGTIVENIITINRNPEEGNYLPIKETNIKIEIPKINDKLPIAVNVSANKLMATVGKELTGREFTKDNWSFDKETGMLEINIENKDLLVGKGEDKIDIICRYEDYFAEEKINLDKKVYVKVEEYSSNENILQEVIIEEQQEKEVVAGELMSYAIVESEDRIGKGKVNANYHIDVGETRFSNRMNVTVLTSDILSEVVIEPVKAIYKNAEGNEFDASQDLMYAGVRFNYAEIKDMLEQGSTIDLLDGDGNVFHTISKDITACKIEFANKISNLKVKINDVKVNGNLSIEFVKSIGRSNYTLAEFTNFETIENTYKASVKYIGFEDVFQLPEIKDEHQFTGTVTKANLTMNTAHLSTLYENQNVEFKIDLINNLETSDIYKNPSFELVFPTFVKEVKLNNIYTLYQNGLSIKNHQVVNENGVNKIIVELEGIQNGFNFSNITNGTNIIINTNLKVDEITPQKQDEIKLYFCNEAVTNYQTQANWNLSKPVPEGILRDTNGYDASTFEYQAPSGMITINSITNYDGNGSTIKSFNQGEVIKTIPIKGENQRATMEISVLNNTGHDAENAVLIGRIPFKGNKDVETGKDLGSNVDTIMKSALIPDAVNSNNTTIYYSSNPNADKDLNNEVNGWSPTYAVFDNVKSYMIVVDGVLETGGILKFKYDFEIPANLGYEVKMIGSFGAFYNNQSSIADKVGLITEAGAKYEANISVDIGDGVEVGEARYIKYKVTVKNTGSIDLSNVRIVVPKPVYARFCTASSAPDTGNDGYVTSNSKELSFMIEELKVDQTADKEFLVKTELIPENMDEFASYDPNILKDDLGYYRITENNEKVYVKEIPKEFYVETKAEVFVNDTLNGITTNTVKNKLVDSNFDIQTTLFKTTENLESGNNFIYVVDLHNISGKELTNIVVEDILAKELSFLGLEDITTYYESEYDTETNTVKVFASSVEPLGTIRFYIQCNISNMKNIGKADVSNQIVVKADGDIEEKSTVINSTLIGPELVVTQESANGKDTVLESEEFEVVINVNNKGEGESREINFDIVIPKELEIQTILSEGTRPITYDKVENNIKGNLFLLEAHNSASLVIKLKANPLAEGETNRHVEIITKVSEAYIGKLEVNSLEYIINDNPDRELTTEEQDKIDKENTIENPTAGDDYKQDIEDAKNETSNENESKEPEKEPTINNNNNNQNNTNQDNSNNQQEKPKEPENTEEPVVEEEPVEILKSKVSGQVFKDENKNNARDNNENGINKVQVALYKGSDKIKATMTDSLGKYRFTEVEAGDYTIVFNYDGDMYVAAKYKASNVSEDMNSDAIESEEGVAVTENIKLNGNDVEIDFGLQNRNNFDITVQKYISKAIVNTKGKEKVTNYKNEALAKLEIRSKELANTTIKLEYKIVVTNKGDANGTVGMVYDYLPNELTFDQKLNKGWKLEGDGVLYNETLNKEVIKPGESRELTLVLNKVMTNNNTGTISNKVEITKLSTDKALDENTENNIATQEMIITVSTGRTISIVAMIVLTLMATFVIYGIKTGKIKKAYK